MNRDVFSSSRGPATDTVNAAGGSAYSLSSEEALAQYAATCYFGNAYYAGAEEQLDDLLKHAAACDPVFVARAAVYSREKGWLKDAPAVLLAHVASRFEHPDNDKLGVRAAFRKAFPRVVDNGKMLRNFCQVIASNVTGRQNFGHTLRGVIQSWLHSRRPEQLFKDSVGGQKPSMADVIKMTRTKHNGPADEAARQYLVGKKLKEGQLELLPEIFKEYERYKVAKIAKSEEVPPLPRVDFRLLDSLGLTPEEWKLIARDAKWQMTRMNLETFARHGVFDDKFMTRLIVDRLSNREEVLRSRNFPYQILQAYVNTGDSVPAEVRNALQDAMEHALENVPAIDGQIYICHDVSRSMQSSMVGNKLSAALVGALFTAALMRNNPSAKLIPFSDRINSEYRCNTRDSVMTIAQQIATLPSGGTHCALPLKYMNGANTNKKIVTDAAAVIYVSDYESWVETQAGWGYGLSAALGRGLGATPAYNFPVNGFTGHPTGMMEEWAPFKRRNPQCKLICIDLTPKSTTQAPNAVDRLNVGGFNDQVFNVVAKFIATGKGSSFVDAVKAVDLDERTGNA